ncbi:hypothetical protein A3B21_04850 [Candidatus Uhrbacteria bacterium RIFCSPLOWO2_01_FULL_47_24]|uniref:Uncharacterized protein n=1 Tax=Candidatus Uhrbacteria bacterium RIFCSPLOWO2_01_FULL_47_24 TaxID=1802401 RepID=A0A1F7UWK0_9BACT|nr:MAG: hypothetical protein A3D58_03235 [Candidatus Uhrbacteria bacterium RIFCSPHIGHO2_02_FULL_46_47]OGL75116.1 MAG: hypothetical protein A3F52_03910 [Candidatus Uhrbacteria bacterium RIFCSPHIGHO2_12_FULL_47_11]OGL82017.1 MAG: hypothetical protein A3B21_04850 [Candidatus Uhrbacteria bacterium RIFCSPLOWO2_01_FULL_47_24]OGL85411.1 MAG: hypothetical protein A3J03_05015 [Candidatus Uhrbacteria bacterium RIFCSPLOWO2_02_FULL_46_25]OGL92272.1 MAG: hypothetical protein A3H11_01990 [Candidatus Uhrbacte
MMTTKYKRCEECLQDKTVGPMLWRESMYILLYVLFVVLLGSTFYWLVVDFQAHHYWSVAFLTVVVFLVLILIFLIMTTGLWLFVGRNIIGRILYLFLGQDGTEHIHTALPYPQPAVYIQVRHGGWFRKPGKVVGMAPACFWTVSHAWNGLEVVWIRDKWGHGLALPVLRLLPIVARFSSVADFESMVLGLDHLGVGVYETIDWLKESRDRTKSKIGQEARERLEQISAFAPPSLRERWLQGLRVRRAAAQTHPQDA